MGIFAKSLQHITYTDVSHLHVCTTTSLNRYLCKVTEHTDLTHTDLTQMPHTVHTYYYQHHQVSVQKNNT